MAGAPHTQSLRNERDDDLDEGGLLLVAGEGLLRTYPLKGESVIGRAPECDVVVSHAALSRRHAVVRLGPPLTVQDLGSKNGTRIARTTLHGGEPAPVAVGESFHIGSLSFVIVRTGGQRSLTGDTAAEALRVVDPTPTGVPAVLGDIARSNLSVLILGETGVGKDVLAATIHALSHRAGAFVRVNCAALTPSLFESELFGHEKGAFTGAAQTRVGLLEAAHEGTVFLDEIGELPLEAQAKLLRAIETREVTRVGGVKPTKLDVRFVAATNRDLVREVGERRFRSDLFFRLDGITLVVPPLRERRQAIVPLALQFLREATKNASLRLDPELLQRLEAHDWPGNVRELKAAIERAVLLARDGEVRAKHLALSGARSALPSPATAEAPVAPVAANAPRAAAAQDAAAEAERERIVQALEACAGNQTRAAKLLGVSRATLVNKIALHRIPRPRR